MAKKPRSPGLNQRGALARSTLKIGDLDAAQSGPEARQQLLDHVEVEQVETIRSTYHQRLGSLDVTLKTLDHEIAQRDERLAQARERWAPKAETAEGWRRAGIQERLALFHLTTVEHVVVLAFLALLDFYVFALAAAAAEDVERSFTNAAFLAGGLYGLLVFVCGVMFARCLKQWSYSSAQRKLVEDRAGHPDAREITSLTVAHVNPVVLVATGALFLTLTFIALTIRLQPLTTDDNVGIVVLQSLVPFVAVLVEFFVHDPSTVAPLVPTAAHKRLLKQREETRHRIDALVEEQERAIATARQRMNVERAILNVEQQDMGMHGSDPLPAATVGPPPPTEATA